MAKFSPVDIVEVAYDLQIEPSDWVPRLLEVGRPMFDHGLGVVAAAIAGSEPDGAAIVSGMWVDGGAPDLPMGLAKTMREGQMLRFIRPGSARTVSEARAVLPELHDFMRRTFGIADGLGFWPLDPDRRGMCIAAPLPKILSLNAKARARWSMLGAHIAAGHRLRRQLSGFGTTGVRASELPLQSEAILDPKRFRITDAVGRARDRSGAARLREQALRVDRARGKLRRRDADRALAIWKGLVRGRWSMVDWFDSDGRRFIVAKPNPPEVADPRGLTKPEARVATFCALGDSNQMIAYRLGISEARVSQLLRSASRKLRSPTRADLVRRLRTFMNIDGEGARPTAVDGGGAECVPA